MHAPMPITRKNLPRSCCASIHERTRTHISNLHLVFLELLLRQLAHEPWDVYRQQLFDAVQVLLRELGKLGEVLL